MRCRWHGRLTNAKLGEFNDTTESCVLFLWGCISDLRKDLLADYLMGFIIENRYAAECEELLTAGAW